MYELELDEVVVGGSFGASLRGPRLSSFAISPLRHFANEYGVAGPAVVAGLLQQSGLEECRIILTDHCLHANSDKFPAPRCRTKPQDPGVVLFPWTDAVSCLG